MSNKLFPVFAALCAVLLATRTASCEDVDVQKPDELYDLKPGTAFSFIVTDANSNSPTLSMNSDQNEGRCNPKLCNCVCKCVWGFHGKCQSNGACFCSR